MLEDEYDRRKKEKGSDDEITIAINKSLEKVKQYYAHTGALIYSVTTGKFITL